MGDTTKGNITEADTICSACPINKLPDQQRKIVAQQEVVFIQQVASEAEIFEYPEFDAPSLTNREILAIEKCYLSKKCGECAINSIDRVE